MKLEILDNQKQSATGGAWIYNVEFKGSALPSGIYFLQLVCRWGKDWYKENVVS